MIMKKDFQTKKKRLEKPKRTSLKEFFKRRRQLKEIAEGKKPKIIRLNIIREWDKETVNDFLSDFLNISSRQVKKSVDDILNDLLLRFTAEGIPVKEAESMVIGIEWFIDDLIKKTKGLK